jgi:glycerol-3-phosphate dehydrogenase
LTFCALNRPEIINLLKANSFDLIVIGGGITGAGIALDAASRGLRVGLMEKNDFAYGTSSRSTKLIHGGLRYLKQFEFGLVKEVGSERAVVHDLAPHLVVPEKMLLPLHEKRGLGYWLTSIGLKLYDWLAGVKPEDQRRMLTRAQTLRAEPMLRPEGIKGGALYAEYRTDDARLTIEIIKAAVNHGAIALNHIAVSSFILADNRVSGVRVQSMLGEGEFIVNARCVVNAAGPWVDELRKENQSLSGKRLHLTKGVHIVVPRVRLPVRQAIYFDVEEDGRMIFAIPRGRTTYIGTTDTTYKDHKDEVFTSVDDAQYLIRAINSTFPSAKLDLRDIESCWAGLRPLIHEDGKSASELSRKDEIFESETGLLSIAGGKLTGYRKMAERVVNTVAKKYFSDRNLPNCKTEKIKLPGSNFQNDKERKKYEHQLVTDLGNQGVPEYMARNLVEGFGSQSDEILNNYTAEIGTDPQARLIKAMLEFCVYHEMTSTLTDFFIRRTGLLYFDIQQVIKHKEWVSVYMQKFYSWDNARILKELELLDYQIERAQLKHMFSA